jgi:GntR family transcriptional regulator
MVPPLVKDPVYLQLNKALRELIRTGEIGVGQRFLTEREISLQFGVSRATANKALSNLVAEGVLEFRKGLGTFIRGRPLDYNLQTLVSFTDKARSAGRTPSTELLRFDTLAARAADRKAIERLHPSPDAQVYYMERLRRADAEPVILERRYVLAQYCPGLTADDLLGSLYDVWTEKYALTIAGAEQTIQAVNLRGRDAKLLGVASGAAGFLVTSIGYLDAGQPLWWEQTLYRGDAYEFHNCLGPIQTAGPATGVLRPRAEPGAEFPLGAHVSAPGSARGLPAPTAARPVPRQRQILSGVSRDLQPPALPGDPGQSPGLNQEGRPSSDS